VQRETEQHTRVETSSSRGVIGRRFRRSPIGGRRHSMGILVPHLSRELRKTEDQNATVFPE
jgi:hypothetical protein